MIPDLRIIESKIGPVVPVNDIADMIGRTRQALSGLVRSHKDQLSPFTIVLKLPSNGGNQDTTCITRDGLDDLFTLMQTPRNPAELSKFFEMKRQALAKLEGRSHAQDIEIRTVPIPQLSGILTEYGKRARALATEWGADLAVAQRVVMADAVEKYPDLMPYRALVGPVEKAPEDIPALPAPVQDDLPKADPDFERYFPLQKIADMCKCDEDVARRILEDAGIIGFANRHTTLSTRGSIEDFGKIFTCYPYFPHRMTPRSHIRYHPDRCCHLIREKLFGIQAPLSEFQRVPPAKVG